jgi:hypothetical protein
MTQDNNAQRGALDELAAAKRELSEQLLRSPRRQAVRAFAAVGPAPTDNVVGVGIGEKIASGRPTGEPAIKLFVRVKYGPGELDSEHVLPTQHRGISTDVEEIGLVRPLTTTVTGQAAAAINPRKRMRPAHPGSSVGFQDPANAFVMAGTFGALVHDPQGQYVLSNNHVLADEGRLAAGALIFQPGLLDGGRPVSDRIAQLTRFIALRAGVMNTVDCAIARVLNPADVSNVILRIGPPRGVSAAMIDMIVHKFGRTTSYTVGRVTSVDTDVTVTYETGSFTFDNQIIIQSTTSQPFSKAGDSGSLIVARQTHQAVGLLFAGSATHTIANHIDAVLAALKVSLA